MKENIYFEISVSKRKKKNVKIFTVSIVFISCWWINPRDTKALFWCLPATKDALRNPTISFVLEKNGNAFGPKASHYTSGRSVILKSTNAYEIKVNWMWTLQVESESMSMYMCDVSFVKLEKGRECSSVLSRHVVDKKSSRSEGQVRLPAWYWRFSDTSCIRCSIVAAAPVIAFVAVVVVNVENFQTRL